MYGLHYILNTEIMYKTTKLMLYMHAMVSKNFTILKHNLGVQKIVLLLLPVIERWGAVQRNSLSTKWNLASISDKCYSNTMQREQWLPELIYHFT
jgi:hypothetical protein